MTKLILRIYDWIGSHRLLGGLAFVIVTAALVLLALRVDYREDISDFLPLDASQAEDMRVFGAISGSEGIFAIFQCRDEKAVDPDGIVDAVDAFTALVRERDSEGLVASLRSGVDFDGISRTMDFVYSNIPYFLTETDYERIDSLLSRPGLAGERLAEDRRALMFPTGGFAAQSVGRDPLGLFAPVVASLRTGAGGMNYEVYDGCIFSPDLRKAFVMMTSPFGSSETGGNARLVGLLRSCADSVEASFEGISVHLAGGPVIAVGNSSRIRKDSVLAVSLALVLILALLLYAFRKPRNLLLIAVSIAWGWLFALGCLSLVDRHISIIILGISSVVIGIAVNYPLHMIAHFSHDPDRRSALRDIVPPLVVGNVTTVGAFLALVPLHSTAMRDLGLFAAFLLVGTILFTLLFLPHLAVAKQNVIPGVFSRIGDFSPERRTWTVWVIAGLTVVLGVFSLRTGFDANIANINYMSPEQREDMEYFSRVMLRQTTARQVYAVASDSTMDGALDGSLRSQGLFQELVDGGLALSSRGCARFLCSRAEQERRLGLWRDFVSRRGGFLRSEISAAGREAGFSRRSFDGFFEVLDGEYESMAFECFAPVAESVFSGNWVSDSDSGVFDVVDVLSVEPENVAEVERRLRDAGIRCFDVTGLNSAAAGNLSSDFNYIGWACGFIVFFFLWLALGSVELAILSFIPMAVSWLWILGLMAVFGIQFNIVNVILATFIFGQGDDYTIFMTEGSAYEYAHRRKIMGSYKSSIVLSALIMFIGIGTLIFARHPAMHSLAEVTVVGMLSVVVMAYILPPFIYKWLVGARGRYRVRPLTLRSLLVAGLGYIVVGVQWLCVWAYGLFASSLVVSRLAMRAVLFDLRHIPGVGFELLNPAGENFSAPSAIVCNRAAPPGLRRLCRMFLTPLSDVSPGEEVVPVVVHGLDLVFPGNGPAPSRGRITVEIGERLRFSDVVSFREYLDGECSAIARRVENARYWRDFVVDRYRYKGTEIVNSVVGNLKRHGCYSKWVDCGVGCGKVAVVEEGYGEFALLFALVHRDVEVLAVIGDEDRAEVLRYSAEGVADNLRVVGSEAECFDCKILKIND